MTRQVIVIHGGDTFETYEEYLAFLKNFELDLERLKRKDWKTTLGEKLGESFEVIAPNMPNSTNAKYLEWKIWFEKLIPFLQEEVIFVGHSMGGIFLAKYLAENDFPKKIVATFLVAAPFDEQDLQESLGDFSFSGSLSSFKQQSGEVFLYHSEDDPIVPFVDLQKYKKELPDATVRIFKDRKHFQQEEFSELVNDIQSLQ